MTLKLFFEAIIKVILGIVLIGALLFLPAGTWNYSGAWLLMGILFIPMVIAGFVMMCKNPELLKKRLNAKEKEKEQNIVVKLSGLMFVVGFIVAGLDFRFGWLVLPDWVPWVAAVFFLLAYVMYAEVLRENTYLSMPLVLGSIISFVIFLAYPVIIAMRIKNEEKVLEEGLEGYHEYKQKVRYRLIPFVW